MHTDLIPIGPTNLIDILNIFHSLQNWKLVGLQLGLLYETLEVISTNKRDNVVDCTMAMLNDWLKQKDEVSKHGGPTWEQLASALRKWGENDLANEVERITESSH